MKIKQFALLLVVAMFALSCQPIGPAPDRAEYDEVVQTTVDAYIRFLPRYYGELMFRGISSAPVPTNTPRAPLGQCGYRDSLVTPEIMVVVRPNNDTMYGNCYVDLAQEPVVIKVPQNPENRFWSVQLGDRWTNIAPGIGSRRGSEPGLYGLVGPAWEGDLPEGVREVRGPENITMITFRVGYFSFDSVADSEADLNKAAEYLRRFTVVPLSTFTESGAPEQAPPSGDLAVPPFSPRTFTTTLAEGRPFALLNLIAQAVDQPDCPKSEEEEALLSRFKAHIGQAMGELASLDSDQSTAAAMTQGLMLARRLIEERVRSAKPGDNGWVTIHAGVWDERWLDRAAISEYAIYANRPDSSIYPDGHVDALGQQLDGKYKYTMKLEGDQFPPVSDFWSITIYRSDSLTFADNPIDRYSVGNRTPGLKYGDDGSLTIYVQADSPGRDKESNWLPAPAGKFNFLARYYGPEQAIQDGTYKLPALYREDEIDFLKDQGQLPRDW